MSPESPEPGDLPPLPRPPQAPTWRDAFARFRDLGQFRYPQPETLRRIASGLGLLIALAVVWWLATPASPVPPLETSLPTLGPVPTEASRPLEASTTIVVHVAGEVHAPGLVEVAATARVADTIRAAGGATSGADLDRLNLARGVDDGERVYVPGIGEEVTPELVDATTVAGGQAPVDLNTAPAGELDGLPGIGPAIAQAIVDHRTEHGPFSSISSLEQVPGIGPAKLAQLRDLVTASQ
jgi:competence protein ComEA